jgi:LCP family protein required for cell wall assembly
MAVNTSSAPVQFPALHTTSNGSSVSARSRGMGRNLFWGLVFLTTASVSAVVGATLTLMAPFPSALAAHGQGQQVSLGDLWRRGFGYHIAHPINILVLGIDRVPGAADSSKEIFAGRSDTMLLLRVDPTSESVNVLSIPRDTRVDIPENGLNKINYANEVGGATLAARTVSYNFDGVPIDRYVRVSTSAFRELVDLMGGVRVFVPVRMYYVDNTQGLKIDLQPGWQTLNGSQAEQFARFRHDGFGDIGRVQRQQALIKALRERVTSPAVLPKLPEALQILQRNIDTNLSIDEMLALIHFGLGLGQDNFKMVMLPGRFSTPSEFVASYWILDPNARDQIMRDFFQVDSVNLAAGSPDISQLRVAVQNASTNPNLGREVANYLQAHGYSNVYVIEDWPDRQQQTQIIAQRGNVQEASQLTTALGLGQVVSDSTGDLESDLTIRVGEDWVNKAAGL